MHLAISKEIIFRQDLPEWEELLHCFADLTAFQLFLQVL